MDNTYKMQLYELYYIVCAYGMHNDDIVPYDIDMVWDAINQNYALDNQMLLDIGKDDDKKILFEWIRNKTRYELLDQLILQVFNKFITKGEFIDQVDLFFISNLGIMKEIMDDYGKYIIKDKGNNAIPKISKDNVINHVKNILLEIDASGKWQSIYEKVIDNHQIIYLNELSEIEKETLKKKFGVDSFKGVENACFFLDDCEWYIVLTYNGDINDISKTVHEIVHYISRVINKGKSEVQILREMPSIFFEFYTVNYLKRLGYDDEELKDVKADILIDMTTVKCANDLMEYLIMLIDNGKITEEEDIRSYSEMLDEVNSWIDCKGIKQIEEIDDTFFDAKTGSNKRCDCLTYDLITDPYILFRCYPYIVGYYLAVNAIKMMNDNKEILSIMKYIVTKISKIDAYKVFNMLGCNRIDLVPADQTLLKRTKKIKKSI